MRWPPAPSRKAGERPAGTFTARSSAGGGLGSDFECSGGVVAQSRTTGSGGGGYDKQPHVVTGTLCNNKKAAGSATSQDVDAGLIVAHTLRGEGLDASEDGTGRGTPIVAFAQNQLSEVRTGAVTNTLNQNSNASGRNTPMVCVPSVTAFSGRARGAEPKVNREARPPQAVENRVGALDATKPRNVASETTGVRRLTPVECERLQGFPDGWTAGFADSTRYRMLGNAVAVPCAEWIGKRMSQASGRAEP